MKWLLGIFTGNPLVMVWAALACIAFGVTTGGVAAWKFQGARLATVKAEYAGFVATTKAEGEAAQKAADIAKASDLKRKELSDAHYTETIAALNADVKRLRDQRTRTNYVPAASTPQSPDRACFKRAELEQAIRDFDTGVQGLVDQGSTNTVGLDTARLWAQGRTP